MSYEIGDILKLKRDEVVYGTWAGHGLSSFANYFDKGKIFKIVEINKINRNQSYRLSYRIENMEFLSWWDEEAMNISFSRNSIKVNRRLLR